MAPGACGALRQLGMVVRATIKVAEGAFRLGKYTQSEGAGKPGKANMSPPNSENF